MYAFILTGSRQFPILTVIINSRWCSIVFIKGWPSSITTIVPQEGFIDETLLLGVVTTFFDFRILMQHFLQTIPFVFFLQIMTTKRKLHFSKKKFSIYILPKFGPTWSWKAESRWWFRFFFNDHSEPHLSALFLVNQPGKLENIGRFAPPIPSQKKSRWAGKIFWRCWRHNNVLPHLGSQITATIWDRIFASQTQQLGPRVLVNVLCGFLQFVLGMGVFVEDIPMVAFF